ncbi:outer membrane lipoprotein LolB [Bordetella holmesii]|uniref:lipoprotein insertase outer membrane protein LolB n=1 Tax=Bordetella holmesii TaxID=35814 RepID=UPI0002BB5416|nr:lipoprotein insertase outer membrane protein LolB [Bordetella holmesii]AHV93719.1 outer membrane lipoprotein LolB [Bordetella holmesii ATCC 51541]AMD50109.1 membrane protein [Bordetella holmesii F627]AUL20447.1 outer membrane lipoprotein LolB [Bordetella holmesii]AUL23772.1 outer membrane lipoprotein LolB [Bordetella holmesii]AUL27099.1 outer membrane lipoprotein LolB [Bordetella holmesii]
MSTRRDWLVRAARLGLTLSLGVVAACSSLPKSQGVAGDSFARAGRFAITATEADGRQQAVQGGFQWQDNGQEFVLDLTNPLGSTEARVQGRPGAAQLTRANGSRLQANDPDTLAEDALGSPVPVSGLRDWLRGRLASEPAAQSVRRDEAGHLARFDQGGWSVQLSRYDSAGPQLLMLERQEAGRRIVVRLVINPA